MKHSIKLWQLWGFATATLGGTILHFLYDWSNKSPLVAPFSGINESTFEHMKLLYFPMLIFAIIESFFFKEDKRFWCVKLRGILLGLALIPIIFYTYNGVIGKSPDWVNIAIFFVAAALSYLYETKLFLSTKFKCKSQQLAILLLCIMTIFFVIFTFYPPKLNIFKDPISNDYGI